MNNREKLKRYSKADGDCILWIGGKDSQGYGRMRDESGAKRQAHRVSFEEYVTVIPDGLQVMHLCDRRACINPHDLVMGTHKANMADMALKRRSPRGAKHYKSRMTPEKTAKAVELRSEGLQHSEIAERLGVSRPTITRALSAE